MDCRYCEHLNINTIERGASCKFGLVPKTCGRFELAECYKASVEEEARLGCEYGTYCDGEDSILPRGRGGVKAVMDKQEVESLAKDALEHNPLSAHCERVLQNLEEGKIPCFDFRIIRSAVLCKSWEILEREKRTRLPVSEAWAYIRTKCRTEG